MTPQEMRRNIEVCAGIRRAFAKFKHHEKLTKRCLPYLEAELPAYTIRFTPDGIVGPEVRVWGNGIDYANEVRISTPRVDGDDQSWQARFAYDLERQDASDSLERAEQESTLYPELQRMTDQIKALRNQAATMIEALPIPASATIRKDSVFWESASYELRKAFPELFE